jgi:hypothetical protein
LQRRVAFEDDPAEESDVGNEKGRGDRMTDMARLFSGGTRRGLPCVVLRM